MAELAASLSAADLQVVVMGEVFVGMIHPCKIYNVLMVGAPVVYLGPEESHIADVFDEVNDSEHLHRVRHGDVEQMVRAIRRAEKIGSRGATDRYRNAVDRYGASTLLERQLDLIEASESTLLSALDTPGRTHHPDVPRIVRTKPSMNARGV